MHTEAQHSLSRRGAFSLIEAVVSLVIVTVLMLGLSSSMMLGSFAIPSSEEFGLADAEVHEIKTRIRDDIQRSQTIAYSKSGNTTRITLTINPTGVTGEAASIIYEFIGDAKMIRRRIDAEPYEVLSTSMDAYRFSATHESGILRYVQFQFRFDATIQKYFELHVRTPYRPELQ